MKTSTRKILDKSFSALALSSMAIMCAAAVAFLAPIIINGSGAVWFKATVEHFKFLREVLDRGSAQELAAMTEKSDAAREKLYSLMRAYESPADFKKISGAIASARRAAFAEAAKKSAEFVKILDENKGAASAPVIKKFGEGIFADYSGLVSGAAKRSSSPAMAEFLAGEKEALQDGARAVLEDFAKIRKLSVLEKGRVRRELPAAALENLGAASEKVSEDNAAYAAFKEGVWELLGPMTQADKEAAKMMRRKFGQTRMDVARKVLGESVLRIRVNSTDSSGRQTSESVLVAERFKGTPLAEMAKCAEENFTAMMQPRNTFYWGFLFDSPYDSNIFGGIFPMILGTFYLTVGAMIFAAPLGIVAAIYFSEYAKNGRVVNFLRMCVGTLAGVPSIVFGLFGLAFLINTVKVSESKSVLAGSITLALLILPTIIRSCEEALKTVPNSYREAALGLGAGKWRAICTVILPAALPGMLTGIIISMGRAAGETAPIIFTAATSTGAAIALADVFTEATPALPWNIYNICSEHEMADKIEHVQYGMVLTLIAIVLLLNSVAIVLRDRLQKKLRG
ncbi:MAG: phosphate ABC transporter, permease protein PstA [Verrucomicrobia bacterium CAG:312_58_20]|nr:MAG: phosphate ABC transporter, permease protein PstA [Verrucomicrobia bacterium CAG:312_58_20]